jgi:hypothetical protein
MASKCKWYDTVIRNFCFLLESIGADSVEERQIARRVLEGKALTDRQAASDFKTATDTAIAHVAQFEAFAAGDKDAEMYANGVRRLVESVLASPSVDGWTALQRHATHCRNLANTQDVGYLKLATTRLSEDAASVAVSSVSGLGSNKSSFGVDVDKAEAELTARHEKFIKAIEKSLKVQVEKWDPIREGLVLYLDPQNTDKFADSMAGGYTSKMENFLRPHGYMLVRSSTDQAIRFGHITVPLSRWYFIYVGTGEDPSTDVARKASDAAKGA